MINMLLMAISTADEVFVPLEHAPSWMYWMIAAGVVAAVVAAAYLISKKIK